MGAGAGAPSMFRGGGKVSKADLARYEKSDRDKKEDRAGARAMKRG